VNNSFAEPVRGSGLTMLLAEQHMGLVEKLASRVYALERGVIRLAA
jgi:ABC-type branched-subunit amino acid transport system ATPase component